MPLDEQDLKQVREIVKDTVQEIVRDSQTEILRGLERFSRGNFARLHRLEVSDTDLSERLNALEERVMALETRPSR
jgi:DNA-binding HxlR family transcriptional regulator